MSVAKVPYHLTEFVKLHRQVEGVIQHVGLDTWDLAPDRRLRPMGSGRVPDGGGREGRLPAPGHPGPRRVGRCASGAPDERPRSVELAGRAAKSALSSSFANSGYTQRRTVSRVVSGSGPAPTFFVEGDGRRDGSGDTGQACDRRGRPGARGGGVPPRVRSPGPPRGGGPRRGRRPGHHRRSVREGVAAPRSGGLRSRTVRARGVLAGDRADPADPGGVPAPRWRHGAVEDDHPDRRQDGRSWARWSPPTTTASRSPPTMQSCVFGSPTSHRRGPSSTGTRN